jgi:hypothetical protein
MRKRESNFYLHLPQFQFRLFSNYGWAVSSPTLSSTIFVVTLPPLTCFFIIPQQFLEKVLCVIPQNTGLSFKEVIVLSIHLSLSQNSLFKCWLLSFLEDFGNTLGLDFCQTT